jgi:hypothetical protein
MASGEDSKTDKMNSPPKFFTLREAAAQLKLRPGTLSKAARKIGACSEFGRTLVMSEDDIIAVYEANRVEKSQNFTVRKPSLSEYQISERLKKLMAKPRKRRLTPRKP